MGSVAGNLLRPTRELRRATLKHSPIWSCTRWGLPSCSGHPEHWCALTAPFHPYPASNLAVDARRFAFCCTFLHVTVTPRYGAPCPVVFGLSSRPFRARRSFCRLRPAMILRLTSKSSYDSGGRISSCPADEAHYTFGAAGSGGILYTPHCGQEQWQ